MNNNKNAHGGLRAGAGRKLNSGIYGEATKVIRVPESKVVDIQRYIIQSQSENVADIIKTNLSLSYRPLDLFEHKVPAGFPSPADDHIEKKLDLMDNFSKIDTNSDGELDLEELKVFYSNQDKPKRKNQD